jgi:hypothetical protein
VSPAGLLLVLHLALNLCDAVAAPSVERDDTSESHSGLLAVCGPGGRVRHFPVRYHPSAENRGRLLMDVRTGPCVTSDVQQTMSA